MLRCRCGGFVPKGITRCPNCGALSLRPRAAAVAGAVVAAQLITACACYGGPVTTCAPAVHRGMATTLCATSIDCTTPLPDGGSPTADPTDDFCFNPSRDGGP